MKQNNHKIFDSKHRYYSQHKQSITKDTSFSHLNVNQLNSGLIVQQRVTNVDLVSSQYFDQTKMLSKNMNYQCRASCICICHKNQIKKQQIWLSQIKNITEQLALFKEWVYEQFRIHQQNQIQIERKIYKAFQQKSRNGKVCTNNLSYIQQLRAKKDKHQNKFYQIKNEERQKIKSNTPENRQIGKVFNQFKQNNLNSWKQDNKYSQISQKNYSDTDRFLYREKYKYDSQQKHEKKSEHKNIRSVINKIKETINQADLDQIQQSTIKNNQVLSSIKKYYPSRGSQSITSLKKRYQSQILY